MRFSGRITRVPHAFEAARGAEALAILPDAGGALADLIRGTAGSSPFLAGLIRTETAWLPAALDAGPESARDTLLDAARALPPDRLAPGLRQIRRRMALLTALADLGGVWPLETVTGALTRLADVAVDRALGDAVAAEIGRGRFPGAGPDDSAASLGLTVLAMGKMGAAELNYSSDIDLICLFDESRHDPDAYFDVRTAFIRATRRAMATLSRVDADGYVFRTDLRLRPDPSTTPVCMAMEAAERYYESVGRTWERGAYIKARAAACDIAGGADFLQRLSPFVWRRHLDFAAIQDAHDMRLRIREHRGLGGAPTLEGRNIKLAPGGIREIEFFTQTRQLIAGGRDLSLRVRGTVAGLGRLAAAGWITQDSATTLAAAYRAHRETEHRLQMLNDAQTHSLPGSDAGFAQLAALMGTDADDLRRELKQRIALVAELTEDFFKPAASAPDKAVKLGEDGERIIAGWRSYAALRSERAQAIFERLKPALLARLEKAEDPMSALTHFDGFLRGLPAGVQLFSLFQANPQLIDLMIAIADSAPELAIYLSRNAQVFDAVIGGSFFEDWPGEAALTDQLAAVLAANADYEHGLDAARRWGKEWHFRIGVHLLRGLIGGAEAGRQYADLAGAILSALWPVVVTAFAAKHGAPPGRGAAIVGMGSLGARRLNARSDLDLIVIYDAGGAEMSDGRRPLPVRVYYARLTQALVTALSAPTAEGRLYEVDMRLRPSGRKGPVATSLRAFRDYQTTEAWTWEHLALTRARPLAGDVSLGAEIEAFRRDLLARPGDRAARARDTADMRRRLADAKPRTGPLDVRAGPGHLQDIELFASLLGLLAGATDQEPSHQIAAGQAAGLIAPQDGNRLSRAQAEFWQVHAATRLLTGASLDPARLGADAREQLLRGRDSATIADLVTAISVTAGRAADIIDRHLQDWLDDGA